MHVVATAGHVDHGKSTLIRALTGTEPDRWAEERRRGMTIDLGYAWTTLPAGAEIAFVDVPGHQRFIANMLAGLGPAPAVLFVVAADEGWSRQSDEHLAAVDALGLGHGVLVITRSDLAGDDRIDATTNDALTRIARSSLGDLASVAVSAPTGAGLDELRSALDRVVTGLPAPQPAERVRLWIDRAFTVAGSGTVVTGTLGAGSISAGDELELNGRAVGIRSIQTLGRPVERATAVARVALNLRATTRSQVGRGAVLLTPGAWHRTATIDARLTVAAENLPADLVVHVGTAAVAVRLRPLGGRLARLTLQHPLALSAGDRAVLRDPGRQAVAAGLIVLDADPPALARRGAAAQRARDLGAGGDPPSATAEIARRGAVTRAQLSRLGFEVPPASDHRSVGGWLVDRKQWTTWTSAASVAVSRWAADHPLHPAMPLAALTRELQLPSAGLLAALVAETDLQLRDGRVRDGANEAEHRSLGSAEGAVLTVEQRLARNPFDAPDRDELASLRLGHRELAAAVAAGRILRLPGDVVLLPSAPGDALTRLRSLPQPFTTSQARQVLATTRRVVIPLLEHLDGTGRTERLDAATRRLC